MTRHTKLFTVYSLMIVGCLIMSSAACVCSDEKVSAPFQYSGYTYPEYADFTRSSEYVEMSDGVKLAVTSFLPSEGPSEGPFPVIFTYLPYQRENIDPATGELKTFFDKEAIQFFTSYGYAWVFGNMRGGGASQGTRIEFAPPLSRDGKELVDWIAAQVWCDGNVGMIGGSYHAWSQFATAGQKPEALKCIIPTAGNSFDLYSSAAYNPGGIYNKGIWDIMDGFIRLRDLNYHIPDIGFFPAVPVVDEDGDGELADEIPLDLDKSGSFLDDGYQLPGNPPQYSDGEERQHIYYKATLEHLSNQRFMMSPDDLVFRDTPGDGGYTFADLTPVEAPISIAETDIAIYGVTSWFDLFIREMTTWYSALESTNMSKMVIAPMHHAGLGLKKNADKGPYWEYFGEDVIETANGFNLDKLRFLDRYLKGIQNGIDTEPPINIYVMNGEGWRVEKEWPIERQVTASLYFEKDNGLSLNRKNEGSDDYLSDFTTDSRQSNGATRWNLLPPANVITRTEKDLKCLTYTSAPLKKDAEVTGHPIVHLWVSSTADYGDFFVYLEDVDENGEAYFVTDGMLRAGFANLAPKKDIFRTDTDIDFLPGLPWHGYNEADYVDGIFAGGNIAELVFDLMPTSWVFKEGHRIRVSIASADWPVFKLHPRLAPTNDPADPDNIIPTITVYRNAEFSSRIELPVIPKKKLKDNKVSKWLKKRFNP